jgi:hypothetical protein
MNKDTKTTPCHFCRRGGTLDGGKAYYCVNESDYCYHDMKYPCYAIPIQSKKTIPKPKGENSHGNKKGRTK